MPGTEHLEFLLDLDAKVDGALRLLDTVDKSIKALHDLDKATTHATAAVEHVDRASHHAAAAHDKHARSLWQLGHHFEYVKNGIHEFAEALGLVLAFEVIEKLVDKVKELGEEIIHAAAKADRAEKSFKLLLGEEGGDELLGYLEKITQHTEFTNDRLRETSASLLRVGFAGEGLHRAMAAALDISALPGGNLEEALSSLERLKRTGRVDNRTLGGIGFGEKDFLAQLSARTGKPSEQLKKDMEKGKLDVTQALESLYDLIHKRTGLALGGAGVKISETLSAHLTHLKDVPEEMFKALSKTEAFDRLNVKVASLLKLLGPEGKVGEKLGAALETLFTRGVQLVEGIDFEKWGNVLIEFLDKLPERLEAVGEVLEVFGKIFKGVAEFVYDFGTVIGELAAILYLAPGKIYDAAMGLGKAIWQGIRDGILGGITYVTEAVSNFGDAIVGKLKGVLGIHSPSVVFEDMGLMSGAGYVRGLDNSADRIDAAVGRALTVPDSMPAGSFARPAGGAPPSGPIQVVINVTVTSGGGGDHGGGGASGAELGHEVAKAVESILPGALQSAFQRMQQEAGS